MSFLTDDYDGDRRSEIAVVSPLGLAILKQSGSSLVSSMTAPNGIRFGGGWLLNTADNHFHEVLQPAGDAFKAFCGKERKNCEQDYDQPGIGDGIRGSLGNVKGFEKVPEKLEEE